MGLAMNMGLTAFNMQPTTTGTPGIYFQLGVLYGATVMLVARYIFKTQHRDGASQ